MVSPFEEFARRFNMIQVDERGFLCPFSNFDPRPLEPRNFLGQILKHGLRSEIRADC